MSIYILTKSSKFPNPLLADDSGVLAIGGDLSTKRLIEAYKNGIFPWYNQEDPIIWWAPKIRFVLYPDQLRVSRSTKKFIRKTRYEVTLNKDFSAVITECRNMRIDKEGTWINKELIEAYTKLNQLGYAHSVETWFEGELIGGLYGVSLGKIFFGESMFSKKSNASKIALIQLTTYLKEQGYKFIDCQIYSKHLESLGACTITNINFLNELNKYVSLENYISKLPKQLVTLDKTINPT